MLISYSLKNFNSFKEKKSFNLYCTNHVVKKRYKENYCSKNGVDIFKTAIVVGENAGGKTNLFKSLDYLSNFIFSAKDRTVTSARNVCFYHPSKKENGPNENQEQEFSFDVLINGMIYGYFLSLDNIGIINEELTKRHNFRDSKKIIFKATRISVNTLETKFETEYKILLNGYDNLKEYLDKGEILNKNNGLFINRFSLLGIEEASEFLKWFNNKLQVRINRMPLDFMYSFTSDYKEEDMIDVLKSKEFLEVFKLVDSSIKGIIVDDKKPFQDTLVIRNISKKTITSKLAFDSSGVCQFFAMAYEIYKVIYQGKTIFADECDSFLNPVLTNRVFNYIYSFDNTGQLILSTHDINHLNFQTFMKEQMFVATKNKETLQSDLYNLCVFKDLRYDSNQKIYEYYLKGLLGGVDNE